MAFGRVKAFLTARKYFVERKKYLNDYHKEMANETADVRGCYRIM
jgi:GH35 family endo-1,4-beta-xylanase